MCGAIKFTTFHLEYQLDRDNWIESAETYFNETDARFALIRTERKSNMKWRIRKDETISTYIESASDAKGDK